MIRGQRGLAENLTPTSAVVSLASTAAVVGVELVMQQGAVNVEAEDDAELNFDSVPMRNQAQTRQVEIVGTNALSFSMRFFGAITVNDPPTLVFTPPGPYTNAVGTTNAFVVSATDPEQDPVTLGSGPLPFTASFDENSGQFQWAVTNLLAAGTTNWVSFTADDGVQVVTNTVSIVVPWDANENGMPDDWEFHWFAGDMTQTADGDKDQDGFANYAEWVASTDPNSADSYIGWEMMFRAGADMTLVFQAVPTRSYHIEGNDNQLPLPTAWQILATVTNDGDNSVTWTDSAYPTNAIRHYRIKVPAFVP